MPELVSEHTGYDSQHSQPIVPERQTHVFDKNLLEYDSMYCMIKDALHMFIIASGASDNNDIVSYFEGSKFLN